MILPNETRVVAPGGEYTDDELRNLILRCDSEGRRLERPSDDRTSRQLVRVMHGMVADRLTQARNHAGMPNDEINQAMHASYLERGLEPKAWTYSNAISPRLTYLPEAIETEMLAEILKADEARLGLHLRIIPWALEDQEKRRGARRERTEQKIERRIAENDGPSPATIVSGDLKISQDGEGLSVWGKVWCDKATAQKLRMMVPLRLLQQAHGDRPWSYEIKGRVHDWQLYMLMHVLYGTPRVLQVELE